MEYFTRYGSPLGEITLTGDGTALTGLWLPGQNQHPDIPERQAAGNDFPGFADTVRWLDLYFAGKDPGFVPAIRLNTTPFRKEVCGLLLRIPYGRTTTYGEIARRIAKDRGILRMSAQAVGGAVGHNPVSVIIPCHRVLGANGELTGYAGGIGYKVKLLETEGIDPDKKPEDIFRF